MGSLTLLRRTVVTLSIMAKLAESIPVASWTGDERGIAAT